MTRKKMQNNMFKNKTFNQNSKNKRKQIICFDDKILFHSMFYFK